MNGLGWRHNTGMCLVAFAWKCHPRWRLVMAGNRDELHARPTAPLARWADAPVLAGRDLRSGGTWMGLGAAGRVAVVTNVRNGLPTAFDGPSRGGLPVGFLSGVDDALTHASVIAAGANRYAPFNLVLADADTCAYAGNRPDGSAYPVAPGIHGLSNGPFDAPWPKVERLRDVLRQWTQAGSDDPAPLWDALADERPAPDHALPDTGIAAALERRLSAAFIRERDYGTRACTLVLVGHDGTASIVERRFGPEGAFLGETRLESSG